MRAAVLALACSTAACGDPLVSGDYRGEPIFKLDGQITAIKVLPESLRDAELSISLFWSPLRDPAAPNPELLEQKSVTTTVRFPATFQLRVFEPPSDDYFVSADATWVAGLLLVYVDADGDGLKGASDPLVGGTRDRGLLYAKTALSESESPTREALAAGFNVVGFPLSQEICEMIMPPPGAPRGDRTGPEFPRCATDNECRGPGLVCDTTEHVCRPSETMQLAIEPNYPLGRPLCRRM